MIRRPFSSPAHSGRRLAVLNLVLAALKKERCKFQRKRAISRSPLFDPQWYRATYDDLQGMDALQHFLAHGESEHRDPGPMFDTRDYESRNPSADGRALTHFLLKTDESIPPEDVIDLDVAVIAERWFDATWFLNRNGLYDINALPEPSRTARALLAYYDIGGPPSPYFDPDDYSQRWGAEAMIEPIIAWARDRDRIHGTTTARVIASDAKSFYGPLGRPRVFTRERLAGVRVAVAIHVFYLDALDDLLKRVEWIPGQVTIMVTTPLSGASTKIDDWISARLGNISRQILITPNIGRNFGPLVEALDGPLRNYDVVLHLHTKKSLNGKSEQVGWRQHLVDGLLPSPAGVQAIVSALIDDEAPPLLYADSSDSRVAQPAGVIHTTTWTGLPSFANHWLGNQGHGRLLYKALGLDAELASGWLDYPVGGMFWARIDALQPLLDLTIRSYEFEGELRQTDRTLAHAIERIIPTASRVAGYDTVELDHTAAQWRWNWSTRHTERVGVFDANAVSELDDLLRRSDVVSVDLFDTLVLRPSTDPAALFDVLASKIGRTDSAALVAERRESEHRLRLKNPSPGDVTLAEIEAEMVSGGRLDPSTARSIITSELALEPTIAIGRRWLIERLRRLRSERPEVRIILMTDTTLPPEAVDALINQVDATDIFDDVFISNARSARKDDGSMWELLERVEAPRMLVHIGDNPMSDLQQASDRGHHWFQTPAPGETPQLGGVDLRSIGPTGVGSRRRATELLVGHGLAAAASALNPTARPPERRLSPEAFGLAVAGPVMTTFARWCIEKADQLDLDVLLFGGRDGHLAHAIACRLAALRDNAPTLQYFPVSRRLALGARLAKTGGIEATIDAGAWEGTLGSLLTTRTGLTPHGAATELEVSLPTDRERVIDAIKSDKSIDPQAHGSVEADALRQALNQTGGATGRRGFVDFGYSGTILRALREVADADMVGLLAVSTAGANDLNNLHTCFRSDARLGQGDLIYDRAKAWEVLCSRVGDQASRYVIETKDDYTTHAYIESVPDTRPTGDAVPVIDAVQRGALSFVDIHLERFGAIWLRAPLDPLGVRRSYEAALRHGLPDPNELFSDLTLDDDFSNRGRVCVVDNHRDSALHQMGGAPE